MVKSRTIAVKQRAAGDYSVSVDRSGKVIWFTIHRTRASLRAEHRTGELGTLTMLAGGGI